MSPLPIVAAILLVLVTGCGTRSTSVLVGASGPGRPTARAPLDVSEPAAYVHLRALQKIADDHGGNRAAGTSGYEASVDYVVGALKESGFDVTTPTYRLSSDDDDDNVDGDRPKTLRNVIAQTRTGDPSHVVMMGAHLDSVPKGPGVVDDGSGVASVLEIARRLGPSPQTRNGVRFALFGSEETGSQGSKGYVKSLSEDERRKIMLYLNVDMVASPNAGYFVQGGTGDERSETGPPGSEMVGQVLIDQLKATGVTPQKIKFVGDDEAGFLKAGIPTAGAENGDRKKKTREQAQAWGGQEGEVYDHCYHSACDNLDNVNRDVFDHYLRALAGTVLEFASGNTSVRR